MLVISGRRLCSNLFFVCLFCFWYVRTSFIQTKYFIVELGTLVRIGVGVRLVILLLKLPNTSHYTACFQLHIALPNLKYLGWNFPCQVSASGRNISGSFIQNVTAVSENEVKENLLFSKVENIMMTFSWRSSSVLKHKAEVWSLGWWKREGGN